MNLWKNIIEYLTQSQWWSR